MSVVMEAFGVPATVTPPAADPIETTVAWTAPTTEDVPGAMEAQRAEQRRVLTVLRSEVPTIPLRTVIVAPEELDGEDLMWMVDGIDRIEPDHVRVVVVPIES